MLRSHTQRGSCSAATPSECLMCGERAWQPLPATFTLTIQLVGPGSSLCWKLVTHPVLAFSWSSPQSDKYREVWGQAPKQAGREGRMTLFVAAPTWITASWCETTSPKSLPAWFQEIPSVMGGTSSSTDLGPKSSFPSNPMRQLKVLCLWEDYISFPRTCR